MWGEETDWGDEGMKLVVGVFPQDQGGSSYLLIIPNLNLVSRLLRQPGH